VGTTKRTRSQTESSAHRSVKVANRFAKPGGNVTGIAVPLLDIRAKQIQTFLLRAGRLEKATRTRVVTRGLRLGLSLTSRVTLTRPSVS